LGKPERLSIYASPAERHRMSQQIPKGVLFKDVSERPQTKESLLSSSNNFAKSRNSFSKQSGYKTGDYLISENRDIELPK
jgi:hypothetical protein